MKFTKMQGTGNDYVYINGFEEKIDQPAEAAKRLSDRHFGVGSDGLILIRPSDQADFQMEMYNADGSLGAMCGNGIRCVGKYVYDHGMTKQTQLSIETGSGIKYLDLTIDQGKVSMVKVNMGSPILKASEIPILSNKDEVISEPLDVDGKTYLITGVSMGNPHAVVFVEDVHSLNLPVLGPKFENHPCFPNRVNTEFIHVVDNTTIEMRVWERGSGETLACGTGACAATVASILNEYTKDKITVKLLGGDLQVHWYQLENEVYMTGPAVTVFEGEIDESA